MVGGLFSVQSSSKEPHVIQSQTILLEPSALSAALSDLWRQRLLCDIVLRTTTTTTATTTHSSPPPARRTPLTGWSAQAAGPVGTGPGSVAPPSGGAAAEDADTDGDTDAETVEGVSVVALAGDHLLTTRGAGLGGHWGVASTSAGGPRPADEVDEVGEVEDLPAHRLMLAATCDYFRALLTGAGADMNDLAAAEAAGAAAAAAAAAEGPAMAEGTPTAAAAAQAPAIVSLPGLDGWALRLAVGALYERRLEVGADTLEGLLSAASYLGAVALLEACAAFMRSNLGLQTCLPLLLLAWRYNLGQLRGELMSYVCRRFSVLVRSRLSAGGCGSECCPPVSTGAVRLASLPLELLSELLRHEELLAECESDVLQCALDWLAEQYAADCPAGCSNGSGNHLCNNTPPSCIDCGCSNLSGASSSSSGGRAGAARELVRLVQWGALPNPPHLQLTRGSAGGHTRALKALLEAYSWQQQLHVTAAAAGSTVRVPPAVMRMQRLLMELQPTCTAPAEPDLEPDGTTDAALQRLQAVSTTAATSSSGSDSVTGSGSAIGSASDGGRGGRPRRHPAS